MRVLVTGGAGFIGSATAAALRDAGYEVTVVDDLSRGREDMLPDDVRFIRADVTDAAAMDPIVAEGAFDACLHFAALIEVGDSMQRPDAYFATNTAGTSRLLEVLLRHDVGRFVFSSTAATYGEPIHVPIDETHPNTPTNPYGESKPMTSRTLNPAPFARFATMRPSPVPASAAPSREAADDGSSAASARTCASARSATWM